MVVKWNEYGDVKFHCSNCQSPLLSLPDCVCPQLSLPNCVITRAVLFSFSGSIVRRLKALIQALYTNTIVCALCTWYTSIVFNTVPWFHCRCNWTIIQLSNCVKALLNRNDIILTIDGHCDARPMACTKDGLVHCPLFSTSNCTALWSVFDQDTFLPSARGDFKTWALLANHCPGFFPSQCWDAMSSLLTFLRWLRPCGASTMADTAQHHLHSHCGPDPCQSQSQSQWLFSMSGDLDGQDCGQPPDLTSESGALHWHKDSSPHSWHCLASFWSPSFLRCRCPDRESSWLTVLHCELLGWHCWHWLAGNMPRAILHSKSIAMRVAMDCSDPSGSHTWSSLRPVWGRNGVHWESGRIGLSGPFGTRCSASLRSDRASYWGPTPQGCSRPCPQSLCGTCWCANKEGSWSPAWWMHRWFGASPVLPWHLLGSLSESHLA